MCFTFATGKIQTLGGFGKEDGKIGKRLGLSFSNCRDRFLLALD